MEILLTIHIILSLTILYVSLGTIAFIRKMSREEIPSPKVEYYPPPEIIEPQEKEEW